MDKQATEKVTQLLLSLNERVAQLNEKQKFIYNIIVEKLFERKSSEPLRMFISGSAGTGKSYLLNTIRDLIIYNYYKKEVINYDINGSKSPSLLVLAPTGVAAININGKTIHKGLYFKVNKNIN